MQFARYMLVLGSAITLSAGVSSAQSAKGRTTTVSKGEVDRAARATAPSAQVATPPVAPVVETPLPSDPALEAELDNVLRLRAGELRYCYEQHALRNDPSLTGEVTFALTVAPTGEVTKAHVLERTWNGEFATAAESCIQAKLRTWRFAESEAGLRRGVSFPVKFLR